MAIPFIPYKKEYGEQMRILVALLEGKLHPDSGPGEQSTSPYPRLTGLFQNLPVEIQVHQLPTRDGSDPLYTMKYLDIAIQSSCPMRLSVEPKGKFWWLKRLLWWKRIIAGEKQLDDCYQFSSPQPHRARRLLTHKKIKNQLLQMTPFHSLEFNEKYLRLRYPITSHQVFTARRVAEILGRLLRLVRLCQNLT